MNFTLQTQILNNYTIDTVSARDIWTELQSKQEFSTWIKKRIEQSGFEENVDYILLDKIVKQTGSGGHNAKEYHISVDMAKHLGMMERNAKGKEVRQYFINKEHEPKEPLSVEMIAQLATQMGKDQRKLMAVEAQNAQLTARASNIENVIDAEVQRINLDINQLQIDSQNGVPPGYMSKRNAHLLYGLSFARKAFEKLMAGMPVKTKKYIHAEAGHSSRSVAYHTNDVIIAVRNIKNNIIQLSAKRATCTLVPNVEFRYS